MRDASVSCYTPDMSLSSNGQPMAMDTHCEHSDCTIWETRVNCLMYRRDMKRRRMGTPRGLPPDSISR